MSHVHDSDTAYDGWCATCPLPLRWRLSYWVRPYDMLLDARRWRWQKSGHKHNRDFLAANPWVIEAAQRRLAADPQED